MDHPRTCGEKYDRVSVSRSFRRITPAHAGKSFFLVIFIFFFADHPRTCGEKSSLKVADVKAKGSPPHMRGKGGNGQNS